MKKFSIYLFLLLFVGICQAQNAEKKWAVGLGAGYVHNLEVSDHDIGTEFYLSRYLSPSFDIRLKPTAGFFR